MQIDYDEKTDQLEKHFEEILKLLGLDLNDSSLQKTPKRMARMYTKELFYGLDPSRFPKLSYSDFITPESNSHMVIANDIAVNSICMHHFIPFTGKCTLAYIPNGKILGLSKINRIVDFLSHKPQLQEKLTDEICNYFSKILDTQDIAVKIRAKHHCVTMRGIRDLNSETTTYAYSGQFHSDPDSRKEFLLSI